MTKYIKARPYTYTVKRTWCIITTTYICFEGDPIRSCTGSIELAKEIVNLLNCAYELGLNSGIVYEHYRNLECS